MSACENFARHDLLRRTKKHVAGVAMTGKCHIEEVGQSSAVQEDEALVCY